MSDERRPVISLLAAQETSPSILYGLYDVLATVGVIFPELTTGQPGEPVLDVKIVAADRRPFRCFADVMVEPHACIDELDATDVALVCDVVTPIDSPPRGRYPREVEWLRRMYANGAILASVCSGSLILAEAGLLDGLEATGHWAYRETFRDHYPKVKWREDCILSLTGEGQRIVTSGGVTAWHDLALYLIARLCDPSHAINTAKAHLLVSHTDGQLPFAVVTQRIQHTDAVISDSQVWIAKNYECSNPVAQMTDRSGLKPRTFARRFRSATGYQPMDYVHTLRVEEAKQLLESTTSTVDEIGITVGYKDPTSFRRLFKRKAGIPPAAYRKRFARILGIGCSAGSGTSVSTEYKRGQTASLEPELS